MKPIHRSRLLTAAFAVATALLCCSCSVLQSKQVSQITSGDRSKGAQKLGHYYLPTPYLEVFAYKPRFDSGGEPIVGARIVAVPDVGHPIELTHDFNGWVQHGLQVDFSPEGFLERVQFQRQPKQIEAVAALARASLMFAGVLPAPVKGDAELPEFSTLLARQLFEIQAGGLVKKNFIVPTNQQSTLTYQVEAAWIPSISSTAAEPTNTPGERLYFRPIRPIKVTIHHPAVADSKNEKILFAPSPNELDAFHVPGVIVANQGLDLRFSGGTLYSAQTSREAEWLEALSLPLKIVGGVVQTPSQLFNVTVNHKYPNGVTDGDKDPTRPRPPVEKD